ncbi:MAG TPA: general secretion pathway protein GspB [Gammaproteobacteria bacterium]
MSFILDALRKSESERQQDARPSITRIPDAVPARPLPRWAIGTIAGLAAAVLFLAVAWWQGIEPAADGRTVGGGAASEPATVRAPLPPPQRKAADEPLPPTSAGLRAASEISPAGGTAPAESRTMREGSGLSSLREAVASAQSPETAAARSPETTAAPAEAGDARPAIDPFAPSYYAMAEQLGLPALRLELHGYSDDPAKRFVFINGKRYREGDTLAEGPRIVGIDARGVVLLAGGRQLRLMQQ